MSAIRASALTALAQATRMLVGLLVLKAIAVTQGTEGFGRLGHFMSMVSILSVLAGGGILNSIVKYTAEYKNSPQRLNIFLSTAALYSFIFSSAIALLLIGFADRISILLYQNMGQRDLICFLALIQFAYGLVSFCNGIVNGLTKTGTFAKISIVGSLIGLPVSCFLIMRYGFGGAVAGLAAINACLLPPALYEIHKIGILRKIKFLISKIELIKISQFSFMQAVSLTTLPIAEIIVRNSIAGSFGWEAAGLWQSLMRLSAVYLGFFTMFLASYYMPILSAMADPKENIRHVKNNLFAAGTVFLVIALLVYVFRDLVFLIVFSRDFKISPEFVGFQLIGDFFKILSYVVAFLLVAKANMKLYVLGELVQSGLYLTLSLWALHTLQIQFLFAAYAMSNFLYFLVCLFGLLSYEHALARREGLSN